MSTLIDLNVKVNDLICKSTVGDVNGKLKEIRKKYDKVFVANINQHLSTLINYIDKSLFDGVITEQVHAFKNFDAYSYDEFINKGLSDSVYVLFLEAYPFGYKSNGYEHKAYSMKKEIELNKNVTVDIGYFDDLVCDLLMKEYPNVLNDVYKNEDKISFVILSGLGNDKVLSKMIENLVFVTKDIQDKAEYIIVLNGCPDMSSLFSVAQLSGLNFKIINMNDNQGIAGGFQAGIDASTSEYIFFFQDDIKINDTAFINKYLTIMEDSTVGLIGGYVGSNIYKEPCYPSENNSRSFYSKSLNVDVGNEQEVDCVLCHVMCYRKSVGAEFDMNYNPNGIEDIDFSFNVRQKGFKVIFSPILMDNIRSEGVTRKFVNPLITRKYHYNYFFNKHKNLIRS